jgi:hypothetical protein
MLLAGQRRIEKNLGITLALKEGARLNSYEDPSPRGDGQQEKRYSLDFPKGVSAQLAKEIAQAVFQKTYKMQTAADGSVHFTGLPDQGLTQDLAKVLSQAKLVDDQVVLPASWSAKDVQRALQHVWDKHAQAKRGPQGAPVLFDNTGMRFMSVSAAARDAFPDLAAQGGLPSLRTTVPLGTDTPEVDLLSALTTSHVGADATDLAELMVKDDLANPTKELAPAISTSK